MSTQIKERPIIFSTPMVQAILNGSKSQSRRVIKTQPIPTEYSDDFVWKQRVRNSAGILLECPYGQVGDLLWVRETWCVSSEWDKLPPSKLPVKARETVIHKADGFERTGRWRSSRFMPRWASRILLEITEVRVERVQEISREDIRTEGIMLPPSPRYTPGKFSELHQEFAAVWDSLNAKRGYGWSEDPWIWVISFRRIKL